MMPNIQDNRMASSTEKLQPEDLHKRMDEFNIRFARPMLRREWPTRHSKTFQKIHDISRLYYEDYINSQDRPNEAFNDVQKRVHDLRQEAEKCRSDLANEETWRESVEKPILTRLQAELVCEKCRDDSRSSEYQIILNDGGEHLEAEQQQESEQLPECRCMPQNEEDEHQYLLFDHRRGAPLNHHPEDMLEKSGIPMRPDRVVGLKMTMLSRKALTLCPPHIHQSPFRDGKVLYPFLVIEAKPEKTCPGFASIEAQTAFPIRRCLQLQADLLTSCGSDLDPLVWFIAYQGDEWRLYVGTVEKGTVTVYDLWHGNIRWHDGALQLIQIMNYISDWARHVYYMKIRQSLSEIAEQQIALTASYQSRTDYRPRSNQVCNLYDQDVEMVDNVSSVNNVILRVLSPQDRVSHPLMKWTKTASSKAPYTNNAIIRHANLVSFSFRLLEIPQSQQALLDFFLDLNRQGRTPMDFRAIISLMNNPKFVTWQTRHDIARIQKFWLSDINSITSERGSRDQDEHLGVFFLFRTFCHPSDWQITREICCVTWSIEALTQMKSSVGVDICLERGRHSDYMAISAALLPLRNMCGRTSVWHALQATNFVLRNSFGEISSTLHLKWKVPSDKTVSESSVAQLLDLVDAALSIQTGIGVGEHFEDSLILIPSNKASTTNPQLDCWIPDRFGKHGATIAVRPLWKHSTCPRFCMFVMQATDFEDGTHLSKLVGSITCIKDFYGILGEDTSDPWKVQLNTEDHATLQQWQNKLRSSL